MTINKQLTRSNERMHSNFGWLNSNHSFSFGGHYDPDRMGFGPLRVVNDDIVAPGQGFPSHPHRDMEIISIVLDGELEHEDSMGNGRVIQPGDIQYMSAGSGVVHSEFNPSSDQAVHFMQIWIEPNAKGLEPRYADQPVLSSRDNEWNLLLSPDGRGDSMSIRQDVELSTVTLTKGKSIGCQVSGEYRGLWMFVLEGEVDVADETLKQGDSLALSEIPSIEFKQNGSEVSKIMLFDVPLNG